MEEHDATPPAPANDQNAMPADRPASLEHTREAIRIFAGLAPDFQGRRSPTQQAITLRSYASIPS